MSPPDPDLLALLYRALREEVGLSIAVENPERLRQKLYQVRAKIADPDLEALMILPDPDRTATHLFICKKRVRVDAEPSEVNPE